MGVCVSKQGVAAAVVEQHSIEDAKLGEGGVFGARAILVPTAFSEAIPLQRQSVTRHRRSATRWRDQHEDSRIQCRECALQEGDQRLGAIRARKGTA
eukprot:2092581-Rhodomonas_salina.1